MWEVRAIEASEADLFRKRVSAGFGRDAKDDDASRRRFESIFDLSRTFAAFEGDDIVGTGSGFSLNVTVPGGDNVAMGGTTVITVLPTHRRRGLLRAMMEWHLDEVAARGEPIAGLWCSETSIYARFGYGIATHHSEVSFEANGFELLGPVGEGTVRLIDPDEAAKVFPVIYEDSRASLPGMLSRSDAWWRDRVLADVEEWRDGKSALRHLLYERDGQARGYVMYRQKASWDDNLPTGEVDVEELITNDDVARRHIWSYLANIDLFPKVEYWNLALDDTLVDMVTDPRRLKRSIVDALWIRVMDVVAALEARRYERDGSVTFEVHDPFRPDTGGTFRLDVSGGTASCIRVSDVPDIALEVDVLGHLYLGGGNALSMARAGRITGDAESVSTLHRLFHTDRAPWCPEVF